MKKIWVAPTLETLNVDETAHDLYGPYLDGAYEGDSIITEDPPELS